jgi:hypothetical protein
MNNNQEIEILLDNNNLAQELPILQRTITSTLYDNNNLVPQLPMLQRTITSTLYDNYIDSKKISKFELIKKPIIEFIKKLKELSNQSKITLVLYNETTQIINDVNEIILDNVIPNNGTNFIQMINELKKIEIEENMEKYLLILTDGQHNTGGKIEDLLNDDELIKFNMCLGIGKECIENKLLKKLSNFKDDSYYISSDEKEINNILFGACLEYFNTDIKNINIELIFENKNIVLIGEKSIQYFNKEELDTYLKLFSSTSNEIVCYNLTNNNFLLKLKNKKKFNDKKIHYIISIDISDSMNENIYQSDILDNKKSFIIDSDKDYIKINLQEISSFTNNLNILFSGKLISVVVSYDINKETKYELIKIEQNIEITYIDKINQYINILNQFNEIDKIPKTRINFKEIKNKIYELYNNNLTFLIDIDELDDWFVQQSKALWDQIVIRYKKTLTKGEEFINFSGLTPAVLCREITTNTYTPNLNKYKIEDTQICKLCYTDPINIVFTECRHAGTCLNCIKEYIDKNTNILNNLKCPFCKIDVNNFVKLNITKPKCYNCDNIVSYYGSCSHPISCKGCINNIIKDDKALCGICNNEVKVMKIYYC